MKLRYVLVSACFPSLALAQGVSVPSAPVAPPSSPAVSAPGTPTVPAQPTSPTDFPAVPPSAMPGYGKAGAAEDGEGAAKARGPVGYEGGDNVVEGAEPSLYGGRERGGAAARQLPAFHVVRKGDSLWKLCDHYYGDPWAWPQLWAHNKTITNPHWIYPGDRLRLMGGQEGGGATAKRGDGMEVIRAGDSRRYDPGPIVLHQTGFADPVELEQAGHIAGSAEERILLTAQSEIYVKGGARFRPQVGQSYSIYKVRGELRDSRGKQKLGHLVEILGTARVKRLNPQGLATAVITEANNPIERAHLVGPLRRTYRQLPVRGSDKNLEARVVTSMRDGKHLGTDELVFIDAGSNQGVQAGHRFLVVRRGDGSRKLLMDEEKEKDDKTYPIETIAEIGVLDVRPGVSIGLVTRAIKELRHGDAVRLRRGY
ncbi:MAG: LysM peptidoglycan-binding domain-containing protein [Deltaproteobacteria bacterium]|nr:LysM peptidoglycan-binding domain-containing protein [Deltaproteobacteria bacterium]